MYLLGQSSKDALLFSEFRKPDFFIVGAAKSGTSSLYNYLIQHPAIFMPELKEPHFFYSTASAGAPVLGQKDLEKYLRLFKGVPDDIQAGEASTSYLYLKNAPQEIKRIQANAKIIMILRDPVERAYSQYWNHAREGLETLSFEEALRAEAQRRQKNWWYGLLYVETGRYAEQVSRYLDVFGRDSVQIHLFEDLSQDAEGVCRKTFSFLGVDPDTPINTEKVYNRSGPAKSKLLSRLLGARGVRETARRALPATWRRRFGEWMRESNRKPTPKMSPKIESSLREAFRDDIIRLEGLIGRDLRRWRK